MGKLPPLAQEIIVNALSATMKPDTRITTTPPPPLNEVVIDLAKQLQAQGLPVDDITSVIRAIFIPGEGGLLQGKIEKDKLALEQEITQRKIRESGILKGGRR